MSLETNIRSLMSQWNERLKDNSQSQDYKNAISECSYELNSVLSTSLMIKSTIIPNSNSYLNEEIDAQLALLESYEPNV